MNKTQLNKLKKAELVDELLELYDLADQLEETASLAGTELSKSCVINELDKPVIFAMSLVPHEKVNRYTALRYTIQGDKVIKREILESNTLKKRALRIYHDQGFFTFIHSRGQVWQEDKLPIGTVDDGQIF